jgi:hypothetical protein
MQYTHLKASDLCDHGGFKRHENVLVYSPNSGRKCYGDTLEDVSGAGNSIGAEIFETRNATGLGLLPERCDSSQSGNEDVRLR